MNQKIMLRGPGGPNKGTQGWFFCRHALLYFDLAHDVGETASA
jgi:hypothetical protein